jgi:anti-anti-sigma factor
VGDLAVSPSLMGVVTLPPEVDLATAPAIRNQIESSLERGAIHVVVDTTAVTFMDSSGINALVRAKERAERSGGSLHVVATGRTVLRLLAVSQLDQVFAVVASVEAAAHCLSDPGTIHSC